MTSDQYDSGYYSDAHDEDRMAVRRGVYLSDYQRALCELSTKELTRVGLAMNEGTLDDKRFLAFEILPILESRWGRE